MVVLLYRIEFSSLTRKSRSALIMFEFVNLQLRFGNFNGCILSERNYED